MAYMRANPGSGGGSLTVNHEYYFGRGSNSAISSDAKNFTVQNDGELVLMVSLSGPMNTKNASVTVNGSPISEAQNTGDSLSILREFNATVNQGDEIIVTVSLGAPYVSGGRSAYQIIADVVSN